MTQPFAARCQDAPVSPQIGEGLLDIVHRERLGEPRARAMLGRDLVAAAAGGEHERDVTRGQRVGDGEALLAAAQVDVEDRGVEAARLRIIAPALCPSNILPKVKFSTFLYGPSGYFTQAVISRNLFSVFTTQLELNRY